MTAARRKDTYFNWISRIFFFLVFLGFAHSFFLKFLSGEDFFYPGGLPIFHISHGIILTVWYGLFMIQTQLVHIRKTKFHRKLGYFGAFWAILVLGSTLIVIHKFPQRMVELSQRSGLPIEEFEAGMEGLLWQDFFMCILFLGFISLGILHRNQPAIHKRLMFFGMLVFLFAAANRMGGRLAHDTGIEQLFFIAPAILVLLSSSILWYDWKTARKIYPVSWIGFVLYWGCTFLASYLGELESAKKLILSIF